jgi:hypothetical protein
MKNIPKKAHFYWGGKILPFLRYMTVFSFNKLNPEWEITLYDPVAVSRRYSWTTPENKHEINTDDFWNKLPGNIQRKTVDFEKIGISNDVPEVIKSDYLRLHLLSTDGGLWADMDILFFKPLTHAFKPREYTTYLCFHSNHLIRRKFHSIGLLMACPDNTIFKKLFKKAKTRVEEQNIQTIGSPFYRKFVDMSDPGIFNIPMRIVYPLRWRENILSMPAGKALKRLVENTIGIHWYAGFPKAGEFQNAITQNTYTNYDNILTHFIRQLL